MRSIAKGRNIDDHKVISRRELEDVISEIPTSLPGPINQKSIKHKPIIKIDQIENISKDYKPKNIAGAFHDKYIKYK